MRFIRVLLAALMLVPLHGGQATSASPSSGRSPTRLPFDRFGEMLVDRKGEQVFVTGAQSRKIVVLDFDGRVVKVLRDISGASHMVLRRRTLYVSASFERIVKIDADRLRRKGSIRVPDLFPGSSLAATDGRLWFTVGNCYTMADVHLGSLNFRTRRVKVHRAEELRGCALVSSARSRGRIFVLEVTGSPHDAWAYDVRNGVELVRERAPLANNFNFQDALMSADGKYLLVVSRDPDEIQRYRSSDLKRRRGYAMKTPFPVAADVHRGRGLIAGITSDDRTRVWLFRPGEEDAISSRIVARRDAAEGGFEFSPSGRKGFLVLSDYARPENEFRVFFKVVRVRT